MKQTKTGSGRHDRTAGGNSCGGGGHGLHLPKETAADFALNRDVFEIRLRTLNRSLT